jgi:hypothetical protein
MNRQRFYIINLHKYEKLRYFYIGHIVLLRKQNQGLYDGLGT